MPQPPDPNPPPDSIVLSAFSGIKNTVSRERLQANELERAINVDVDDVGQLRRRRGYTQVDTGSYHSVKGLLAGKAYGVKDGNLGIIRPGGSFYTLGITIGAAPVCYTEVDEEVYFSSANMSGVITLAETVRAWGETDGQGFWDSPVYSPTDTLGEVGGTLLGDPPPKATAVEAFHGRIYLAVGKTLWRTEVYRYDYVDRTKSYYQLEHEITLVMAAADGLYVGTTGGLYFLAEERILMREFGSLKLQQITSGAVLPGSGVFVPADLVHPQALSQPMPTTSAIVCFTNDGILACFDGGSTYNLTNTRVLLPGGVAAAGLFRQQDGDNQYIAAVDSAGAPTSTARIGDFIDAEIIRAVDRSATGTSLPDGFVLVTLNGVDVTQNGQPVYVAG